MIAILAIGRATVAELRRQRLLIAPLIALVLSLVILGASIVVDSSNGSLHARAAEQAAYAAGLGAGVGAAIYAVVVGAGLIARELSSGTLLMLAARPVARWQIFIGRLLATAVFLVAALAVVDLVYALVIVVMSTSSAPFDDAFATLRYTVPGVLLALCISAALSAQGRVTAAMGTAVALGVFAMVSAGYAYGWQQNHHLRKYMTKPALARVGDDSAVVGYASVAVTRALPLGVFAMAGGDALNARERFPDRDRGPIKTWHARAGSGEFALLGPDGKAIQPRLASIACDDPQCLLGVRDAWVKRTLPPYPRLESSTGIAFAWLAIPVWALIGVGLLARRRDLV